MALISLFFKRQWKWIKEEVMHFMGDFFISGRMHPKVNNSFVTLIPKSENPDGLKDYRPISLVSNLYKIVTKGLANRIKVVMEEVIGKTQFAFNGGKQILDYALIANKVVDVMKKSKKGGLMLKIDFEKAFDSVDWGFLDFIMIKTGFKERWRK